MCVCVSVLERERERGKSLPGFHIKESCEAIAHHMREETARRQYSKYITIPNMAVSYHDTEKRQ